MPERSPSPRRRKLRLVREGEEPADLVVVVRAAPAAAAETVEDVVRAAEFSAEAYVVAPPDGTLDSRCCPLAPTRITTTSNSCLLVSKGIPPTRR